MTVPIYKCICDTNIWVNVCLGKVHETYIKSFSNIGVADAVKNEIYKWRENENRFKDIYHLFSGYENREILIINLEDIDPLTQKVIVKELSEWGFNDLDNSEKTIQDLGEFVSLLYAYHLDIPLIHTHDTNFCNTIQMEELYKQYKGIQMITWYELSEQVTSNSSERLELTKLVESEASIMKQQRAKQIKEKNWKLN